MDTRSTRGRVTPVRVVLVLCLVAAVGLGTRAVLEHRSAAQTARAYAASVRRLASQAWPGPATTGVPAGTHLSRSGPITVTQPGAVVRDRDIVGCVVVQAPDVVIERSRIRGSCLNLVENDSTGLTVRDSELIGDEQQANGQAIGFGNYQALSLNIHGTTDGLRANGRVVVRNTWVHDLQACAACHNDGVQISQGSDVVLRHNRIENPLDETSAVLVKADQGDISDIHIEDNILDGGGYTVYVVPARYAIRDVTVLRNAFGRTYHPRGGLYGPADVTTEIAWSGNTWLGASGALLLAGASS